MSTNTAYIILAIGTDIGKTYLVENLCKQNCDNNDCKYMAIKPVISGFTNDNKSDSAKILIAQNKKVNKENLDKISPWRFKKAVSANFVSDIKFADLIKFCQQNIIEANKQNKILLIEGAGGVMSPIGKNYSFLDVAIELNLPIILVTSNYLGSISHTICSVEAINNRGLAISNLVVNNYLKLGLNKPVSDKKFIDSLYNFIDCKILTINKFITNF